MSGKLAPDLTKVWTAPNNRRRYAAVLIAAWSAFWLILAVQPLCEASASTPARATSQSTAEAFHLTGHADSDRHGADDDPHCPEATALESGVVNSAATTVDRPRVASLASADLASTATRAAGLLQRERYGTPPPLVALYLRHLHLLI
jgi:hypothetical protein